MMPNRVILDFLPSKTFAVRAIVILCAAAAVFWFLESRRNNLAYEYDLLAGIPPAAKRPAVTDEDIDRLVAETLAELTFDPSKPVSSPATLSDTPPAAIERLDIREESSASDIRSYGTAIASAIRTLYADAVAGAETALLLDFLATGNDSDIIDIRKRAAAYRIARDSLAALPIPRSAAPLHLDLMNAYARIAGRIDTMASRDTAASLIAAQSLEDEQAALGSLYRKINAYFRSGGIEFSPDEGAQVTLILPDA